MGLPRTWVAAGLEHPEAFVAVFGMVNVKVVLLGKVLCQSLGFRGLLAMG